MIICPKKQVPFAFKKSICFIFLAAFTSGIFAQKSNSLFQYSIINALQQGYFSSDDFTCKQLKTHGNFGLGTFNELDGEMILKDGIVYQVLSNGKVKKVPDAVKTPLAFATFFKTDTSFTLTGMVTQQVLYKKLLAVMQPNQSYAVRITGVFDSLKLRSVAKQQRPFTTLGEAVKNQTLFNYPSLKGTMIGFLSPEFASNFNVAGFHFHFLNDAASKGGHVLNIILKNAKVEIARMKTIEVELPSSKEFNRLNLSGVDKEALRKAEH